MTPMTKLKNNLDTFKSLAGSQFKEVNLNKSSPKEHYQSWCGDVTFHESVGVMNDFLKLFNIKFNKDNYYGIAFIFDYIDLPENEHKVQYSIKIKEKDYPKEYFITSEKMEVNEFKDKLNQVNKNLKALSNPTYSEVMDTLHDVFIPDFIERVNLTKYTTKKIKIK